MDSVGEEEAKLQIADSFLRIGHFLGAVGSCRLAVANGDAIFKCDVGAQWQF